MKVHLRQSKGRLAPLYAKIFTTKATKDDGVDKIAAIMRRANIDIGLINRESMVVNNAIA